MPLTLEETNLLIAVLGIKVPPAILKQKAKAEEFSQRREKVATQAGGKPAEWRLRAKFDDALKRADASAGQKQFDPALTLLDEAAQVLQQPDLSPEALAALKQLAERQVALETEIARVQAFESPIGAELKAGLAAVTAALHEDDADVAARQLGELELKVRTFEQEKLALEALRVKAEEFKARREKVTADASGKAEDWGLRTKFDGLLRGATDNAGGNKYDVAFGLLDQAEALLMQPDPRPQVQPSGEEETRDEIAGEDFEALFETDPDKIAKREWEWLKPTLFPSLEEAAQKETPQKQALVKALLDLTNLEKSGQFPKAVAALEKLREPIKLALSAEEGPAPSGDPARVEFLVARNKASNDLADAKVCNGFGLLFTNGKKAIPGLEKKVSERATASQWAEGLADVARLHEQARLVLNIGARTLQAREDYRLLDTTAKPKFGTAKGRKGKKGTVVDALIGEAFKLGNALGPIVKAADYEAALAALQVLDTKLSEVISAASKFDLGKVAYDKQWNSKVNPKLIAAQGLQDPPPVIAAQVEAMQLFYHQSIVPKVTAGSYSDAVAELDGLLGRAQAAIAAYDKWTKEREAFNKALADAQASLDEAQKSSSVVPSMAALRDTYNKERKAMEGLVTGLDYAGALAQLTDKVLPAVAALTGARTTYDGAKKIFTDKKAALAAKLAEAASFTPATPELVTLLEAHDKEVKALAVLETARDFATATTLLDGAVTATLDALLLKKGEHDAAKTEEIDSSKESAGKAAKGMLGDMKNVAMVDPAAAAKRVETAVKKNKDLAKDAELQKLVEQANRIVSIQADALKGLATGELEMLKALDATLEQAITQCDTYQQAHKSTAKSKTDQEKFRQAEALRSSHETSRLRLKTILSSFATIEAKAAQPDDLAKAEAAHLYSLLAKSGGTPEIKAAAAARQKAILAALMKDAKNPDRVREIAEIVGEPALGLYKAQAGKPALGDLAKNGTAADEQKKSKLQDPDRAANVDLAKNVSVRLVTDDGGLDLMALHLQNLDDLDDGTLAGKTMARTLKKLRDDPKLQALFEGLPMPERDNPICDMLRATLGKKGGEPLSPAEVKKAVLSAMLAELRQMDVGSCFGTSVTVHVHDAKPGLMLKDMHEMLGTGKITRMAGGKMVEAPVQPRMSDGVMKTPLKLAKSGGKLKASGGEDLDAPQSLENTPAFSSSLDSLGIAGPKRKAALQTAQKDVANQQALEAGLAKLPDTVDAAARDRLRMAVLDKLAATPGAKVKAELAKEVQKLKPSIGKAGRKDVADAAQGSLDAPELETTPADLVRKIALRENGVSEGDLVRLEKMKELRPKVLALQASGDTTSPAAQKLLDEYDALQSKIGKKAPNVEKYMKDVAAAQDGYLAKEDNRLLRCWEYSVSALAEQGISRRNTEKLNAATEEAVVDEFNAALGELDQDPGFKKATKKLDVGAISNKLFNRYKALVPEILQTGYDASVEADVSSDGSSSRGAFCLFDTQGAKNPSQWIKIDDQSKYVTVVRGMVMLAWTELFEREKDKNVKQASRAIADKLAERLGNEAFAKAAKDKLAVSSGSDKQLPWQMISGSHQNFMTEAYFGVENPTLEQATPANPDELAEFVVGATSGMWDKVKDGVADDPEAASVPMGNGPHAFNLKPGGEKLKKLASQTGKTPQEKVAALKVTEQADNQARLDTAASPGVMASMLKAFSVKWGTGWDNDIEAELSGVPNPTVKQVTDAMEKVVIDNYDSVADGKVTELEQAALVNNEPFDPVATKQQLMADRKKRVREAIAPTVAETIAPPVKKADQDKLLDKVIRKVGVESDVVDAVRARALKALGDSATMSDIEKAVREALDAEGVPTDGATSQTILDGLTQAQGPVGIVFADSNWGGGKHRTMFSMVVNPLSGEMEMWQMNEDGTGMKKMDPKTWVECPWDVKTEPKEFGGI